MVKFSSFWNWKHIQNNAYYTLQNKCFWGSVYWKLRVSVSVCVQNTSNKLHWLKASEVLSWRCVCCASVLLFVCVCVHKLCLQKTSPQKLLIGFLPNFTGMFLRWSPFKILQIIVFCEEFWLPWQPK